MKTRYTYGFTLLELLVSIAVSSILLTVGIPSFLRMIADNERVSYSADVYSALNYARSEAIARNVQVVICKSTDGANCSTSANWSDGWIIYANTNNNTSGAEPDGPTEPVLQVHVGLQRFTLIPDTSLNDRVIYLPSGRAAAMGNFQLCSENTQVEGGTIQITSTGRARASRTSCAAETET